MARAEVATRLAGAEAASRRAPGLPRFGLDSCRARASPGVPLRELCRGYVFLAAFMRPLCRDTTLALRRTTRGPPGSLLGPGTSTGTSARTGTTLAQPRVATSTALATGASASASHRRQRSSLWTTCAASVRAGEDSFPGPCRTPQRERRGAATPFLILQQANCAAAQLAQGNAGRGAGAARPEPEARETRTRKGILPRPNDRLGRSAQPSACFTRRTCSTSAAGVRSPYSPR